MKTKKHLYLIYIALFAGFILNAFLSGFGVLVKDKESAESLFASFSLPETTLVLFVFVFIVSFIFLNVFWIMMLVHAVTKKINNKALWIIALILGGPFNAALYHFVIHKKHKETFFR